MVYTQKFKDMKKTFVKLFSFAVCALTALSAAAEVTPASVYVNDFALAPGQSTRVKVYCDNEYEVQGMNFTVISTPGLKVSSPQRVKDRIPNIFEDGEETDESAYVLTGNAVSDTEYRVLCYTMTIDERTGKKYRFLGHSGPLFTLKVTASADFTGGTLTLTNIAAPDAEADGVSISCPDDVANVYVPTPLATIVSEGENGKVYAPAEDLAVVQTAPLGKVLFVSDGNDNWMKIAAEGDVYNTLAEMKTIKAGTLIGTLSEADCNQTLTVEVAPEAVTSGITVNAKVYNLGDPVTKFAPKVNEVISVQGYYFEDDMNLRGYSGNTGTGHRGQSLDINLAWFDGENTLLDGGYYLIENAPVQLKAPWDAETQGSPAHVKPSDELSFQNYTLYPVVLPTDSYVTGVENVNGAVRSINVNGNTINVNGATNVAVYSANGMLVGKGVNTEVPAGVYVVVADGVATKVLVK